MKIGDEVFMVDSVNASYERGVIDGETSRFLYVYDIPFKKENLKCPINFGMYLSADQPNSVDFKKTTKYS